MKNDLIARITRARARERVFSIHRDSVERFGYDTATITGLIDAGLPINAEGMLDPRDLASLSSHLRLPSARRRTMRSWLRTRRALEGRIINFEITIAATRRSENDDCAVAEVALPGTGYRQVPVIAGMARQRCGLTLGAPERVGTIALPSSINDFLDIDHAVLGTVARSDRDTLDRYRLADCQSFATRIAESITDSGGQARRVDGLIVAVPFSCAHSWVEIVVDDRWVGIDVLMANSLREWGLSDMDPDALARYLPGIYWPWHGVSPYKAVEPLGAFEEPSFATSIK